MATRYVGDVPPNRVQAGDTILDPYYGEPVVVSDVAVLADHMVILKTPAGRSRVHHLLPNQTVRVIARREAHPAGCPSCGGHEYGYHESRAALVVCTRCGRVSEFVAWQKEV